MEIDGIHNVVSLHRVSRAKTTEEVTPAAALERREDKLSEDENAQNEYVVYDNIRNKMNNGKNRYLVRWYGYSPSDDTWEPPHHIPQQLIQQ